MLWGRWRDGVADLLQQNQPQADDVGKSEEKENKGPPPPQLPEVTKMKSMSGLRDRNGAFFGAVDMFKGIE
jgi:hypothetical protein